MSETSISPEVVWTVPVLDRSGQETFWDRQVLGYDQADMTRDNEGELDLVRALCQQYCLKGYQAEDVVCLGGAVGSRDPKVVMDMFERHKIRPKRIYFNDLSESMANQAMKSVLSSYSTGGTEVTLIPGPIHEIGENIPAMPRRVIIGVYRIDAFTMANPHYGYPLTGLEEYEKNADIIGTQLLIEPMRLTGKGYEGVNPQIIHHSNGLPEHKERTLSELNEYAKISSADALRIIGRHENLTGYFLSHWFSEQGVRQLVTQCFSSSRISTMSLMPCAKGFVLCIDPVEEPRGIVTVLNNVIGNIIPSEQMETLRVIEKLSS